MCYLLLEKQYHSVSLPVVWIHCRASLTIPGMRTSGLRFCAIVSQRTGQLNCSQRRTPKHNQNQSMLSQMKTRAKTKTSKEILQSKSWLAIPKKFECKGYLLWTSHEMSGTLDMAVILLLKGLINAFRYLTNVSRSRGHEGTVLNCAFIASFLNKIMWQLSDKLQGFCLSISLALLW